MTQKDAGHSGEAKLVVERWASVRVVRGLLSARGELAGCLRRAAAGAASSAVGARRRGISLAEMMIAVVILGLGLLMVASLFPVSWLSARRLAENTTQFSCRQAADLAVRTLLKVDGETTDVAVLPGDQIQFCDCTDCSDQGQLSFEAGSIEFKGDLGFPIGRVHVLNLGNVLFENRAFVGEDAWMLEQTRVGELLRGGGSFNVPPSCNCPYRASNNTVDFSQLPNVLKPVIAVQDRVYPPLPSRPTDDFTDLSADNRRWDDAYSARRYAWAALYRFDDEYICTANAGSCLDNDGDRYLDLDTISDSRVVTMYYVTLRRPKPTARYARQDPDAVPNPDPREAYEDGATPVAALASDQDVMLPTPWRVQVLFPDDLKLRSGCEATSDPDDCPTGIATEITVNHKDAEIDRNQPAWVTGLFDRGAVFIDELSGNIYRVEKARLTDDDRTAYLTLDREVFREDVDFGALDGICDPNDPDCDPCGRPDRTECQVQPNRVLDDCERLRTVWVFPPPVQGGRGAGDPLVFDGSPPVVDIAVQTVMIAP